MFQPIDIVFRKPTLQDGSKVFNLIRNSPPLDTNSKYCNLLQCSHFAATSVVAEAERKVAGFVSGYLIPDQKDTLFVWQVAVADYARGVGLASRMLEQLLLRPACHDIHYIETSITDENRASWALFKAYAKKLGTDIQSSPWMDKDIHFDGQHDSETLVRIGPFNLNQ